MADVGLRDLSGVVPGARKKEPVAPTLQRAPAAAAPSAVIITPPPPPAKPKMVFGGDAATGPDALGLDARIGPLAELALHQGTATPLCIGFVGAPGTGKSFALARLTARVRELAAAASAAGRGPFVPRAHVQVIDAAALDGDPGLAVAAELYDGLRSAHPAVAREIALKSRDPDVALREANEKLDESRRRLDVERRALDDAGSRSARLTETVLYEAAGSQVDAYARANRASLENRLTAFGVAGDAVRNYKDLVQFAATSGSKAGLTLRSLWAYKGQAKLIVAAVVLVLVGVGLGFAIDDQAVWLGDLRSGPQTGVSLANWSQAHMGLLATAKSAAYLLAALCVLANLWRAFAFLQPVFKGVKLLQNDLANRRRDLDGLLAHQTKRVDVLEADVERLSREVAEAERQVGGGASAALAPSPFEPSPSAQSRSFFKALAAAMADAKGPAPQRIVLALDHLDAVAPERACAILDVLHRTAGQGVVTAVALDPGRLAAAIQAGVPGDLVRWIQMPIRIDTARGHAYAELVRDALGMGARPAQAAKPDAHASVLDSTVGEPEADLLAKLAGFVGRSPRAVKRLVNVHRLARVGADGHAGILAFMLAVARGGTADEKKAVKDSLSAGGRSEPFEVPNASPRLRGVLAAAAAVDGRVTHDDAATAARTAAIYSLTG